MNLDFSFYNWDLISNFVLKGLYFSLMLTVVATLGGVLFGTVLALMRLSGKKWLDMPATIYVNGMRSIPLVMVILWFFLLVPAIIGRPIGAELSAVVTFIAFEAAYFSEIMRAGIQSISRGQVAAGDGAGAVHQDVGFVAFQGQHVDVQVRGQVHGVDLHGDVPALAQVPGQGAQGGAVAGRQVQVHAVVGQGAGYGAADAAGGAGDQGRLAGQVQVHGQRPPETSMKVPVQ